MEVIIPCAGLSSRFPNLRPKYMLVDYAGRMMVENAAKNYIAHNISIVVLKQHIEEYKILDKICEAFGTGVNVIILDKPTNGPAETVYKAIQQGTIDTTKPLLIKDCDSFYDAKLAKGNAIYIAKLSKYPNTRTPAAKSYTITNDQSIITTVVEKQIVSDHFCVGGYQFETGESYVKAFEEISKGTNEIYVSNIIDYMISKGTMFFESEVENYVDVGVKEDWFEFNNKPTYFCDIDGTLVKTVFGNYTEYTPIQKNIDTLLTEMKRGCKIVFTTSRSEFLRKVTVQMLNDLGFRCYELIMDVHHSKRVLINDYADSNPYPTAVSVNLKRDSDNLGDFI